VFSTSLLAGFILPSQIKLPQINSTLANNPTVPLTLLMEESAFTAGLAKPEFGTVDDRSAHTRNNDSHGDKRD
jgi:hypothetical protein